MTLSARWPRGNKAFAVFANSFTLLGGTRELEGAARVARVD